MSLSPMTELDAVNRLLELIEEAPVNTLLDFEDDPDVGDALSHLRRASYDFQARGWAFNAIPSITLTPDVTGAIYVPTTICSVPGFNILRDRKLYAISEGTEVFTEALTLQAVRLFEFDELPAEAATFVLAGAAESFLFHKAPGSPPPTRIKEEAWAGFHSYELRLRNARLPQSNAILNRPRQR